MQAKKTVRALMAGALALVLALPLPAWAAPQFQDVDKDHWGVSYIEYCCSRGILDGLDRDHFGPEQHMTRAVLALALYRLADSPPVSLNDPVFDAEQQPVQYPFTDVDPAGPYADAILWAFRMGMIGGYPDGRFGPEDPITREQMATIFWQAQGRQTAPLSSVLWDRGQISSWAVAGVEWAWSVGLMTGKADGIFDPAGTTTRAEGAVILQNYDRTFISDEAEENDEPAEPEIPIPELDARPIPPNRYDSAAFTARGPFLTYEDRHITGKIGIDVSAHQKQIDWEQVAASGVEFAMIRAGYRGYTVGSLNRDAYFSYNIENALKNGIQVGVYFFSQAMTPEEAAEEAKLVLRWIQDYDITYPVVFDWEEVSEEDSRTKDAPGQVVTQAALTFCSMVQEAGYLPMTYGSPSKVYSRGIELEYLQEWPFWLAHYTPQRTPTNFRYHYDMWQYTSDGAVPGIQGRVDLNVCMADWDRWEKA